jgi:hypothetical protein
VKKVFDEIEQQAYFTLKSIRLSTLAASPAEKGSQIPATVVRKPIADR